MKQLQKRAALLATLAAVAGLPAAAAAQDPAPPVSDFAGTWTLAQVDSMDLPVQFDERDNCRHEVTGATLTINTDNTWRVEAQVRQTCGDRVEEKTTTEEGRFTLSAQGIDFDPDDQTDDPDPNDDVDIDELATGMIMQGSELHVQLEDAPRMLVFRKQ